MAKVMLVEDDNNLREIYEARLEAEGYDIVSASDGEEALVVAKAQKPDLVISDVMMPKISGFEMLDILRNTDGLKDVKVIMLTALGQAEDKTRADALGADKYLVKSQVTLEDIIKTTHQLLDDEAAAAPSVPTEVATTPAAVSASVVPVATPAPSPDPAAPQVTPVAAEPTTPVEPPVTPAPAAASEPPATPAEPPVSSASTPPDSTPAAPLAAAVTATPPPATSAPATPTPVAEPEASAATSAAPDTQAPPSVEVAQSTTVAAAPQSMAEEEAAMQAQIDSFAQTPIEPVEPPASPPEEPTATTTTDTSAPEAAAPASQPTNQTHDEVMAEAVNSLMESTEPQKPSEVTAVEVAPAPEEVNAAPAPEAGSVSTSQPPDPVTAVVGTSADNTENVTIAHKKVIQPINDPAAPKADLNQLLAKEQAMEAIATPPAAAVVNPQTAAPAAEAATAIPVTQAPAEPGSGNVDNITL